MWKTEQKVLKFVEENHLIEPGDVLVAGISGGADSVCLHYILLELQKYLDFRFVAVHVNHNLRGEEADSDQEFVERLCQNTQIPVSVVHKNVKEIAEQKKISLEEAGRMARYEAFSDVAASVCGNKIVLAHHQDDLAETMIHHLVRGTGIGGLCSLKPISGNRIRPLLCLTRAEIEAYLQKRESEWKTDSTNLDDDYTRNKIRHHVISYLSNEINPRAVSHMAETAKELQEIENLLENFVENISIKKVKKSENQSFFREDFQMESAYIQRRIFLEEMKRLAGARRDFSRTHVEDVIDLWEKQVGKKISLPYELEAVREYEGLSIRKICKEISHQKKGKSEIVHLQIPGETNVENCRILSDIINGKMERIVEKTYTKWFDYDKITNSLEFRHRQTGDIIRIHPSGGHKKLKDYFIDRKIPSDKRDDLWLVADGHEIVWIVGDRISEKYKVSDMTSKILCIEIKGGDFHERKN